MFINIGFSNYISSAQIQSVRAYDSAKLLGEARLRLNSADPMCKVMIHDCTLNRTKNSIIVCNDGVYYISNKTVGYIVKQLNDSTKRKGKTKD